MIPIPMLRYELELDLRLYGTEQVLQRYNLVSCILVEGGEVTGMGLDGRWERATTTQL
jgi:hypothetical protein